MVCLWPLAGAVAARWVRLLLPSPGSWKDTVLGLIGVINMMIQCDGGTLH